MNPTDKFLISRISNISYGKGFLNSSFSYFDTIFIFSLMQVDKDFFIWIEWSIIKTFFQSKDSFRLILFYCLIKFLVSSFFPFWVIFDQNCISLQKENKWKTVELSGWTMVRQVEGWKTDAGFFEKIMLRHPLLFMIGYFTARVHPIAAY